LTAGAALLALVSSAASAMPVSAPTTGSATTQATAALLVEGSDAAKIENVYWCGRWGCHPGVWHRWGWRAPVWHRPGWVGWGPRARWCHWHPRACGW
jgi:hypothetical protein